MTQVHHSISKSCPLAACKTVTSTPALSSTHCTLADKLVTRAQNLVANYNENGVKTDKILMRLPATWQGIQAAKQLESQGIAAHVTLVYRYCNEPETIMQFTLHGNMFLVMWTST